MKAFAMKTLALAVAALFVSAGTAMAQQTEAFISQVGDDHFASAEQAGGVGNFTFIDQAGDAAALLNGIAYEATVSQIGNSNSAVIGQSGNGNSFASANQLGDGNEATQNQEIWGADAGVRDGIAIVEQDGDDNQATQSQAHFGGATSPAAISVITQTGSGNFSVSAQNGSGGVFESLIDQLGHGNLAEVSQSGFTSPGGFFSEILQSGNRNTTLVTQSN